MAVRGDNSNSSGPLPSFRIPPGGRILLVQTGFIGDVVLSTPVIAALHALYPNSPLSVLTTPLAAPLVQYHPAVSEVISYDKRQSEAGIAGFFRLAAGLRQRRFAAAFSLHKSYRTAALLLVAGISKRFGFNEAALPWLYTARSSRAGNVHEVQRNLAIFRAIGVDPQTLEQRMRIYFPPEMPDSVAAKLGFQPDEMLVGIAPGSVWATKRWTAEGFTELVRRLLKAGQKVVLIGGPDDEVIGRVIEQGAAAPIANLIGKLSLLESACLISQLRLLISNDSAPLHLASAAGTPVVAIFCATVPEFGYGPWLTDAEIAGVDNLPCRPCGRHGGQTCPTGTHACQRDLGADAVFKAAVRLLMRNEPGRRPAGMPLH